jgi:hypothetical protein
LTSLAGEFKGKSATPIGINSPSKGDSPMFEVEAFIETCRSALREKNPHAAVREIVAQAVSQPQELLRSLGEPKLSGLQSLYCAETLTILNVLWGPGMSLYPHDHRMWAVMEYIPDGKTTLSIAEAKAVSLFKAERRLVSRKLSLLAKR